MEWVLHVVFLTQPPPWGNGDALSPLLCKSSFTTTATCWVCILPFHPYVEEIMLLETSEEKSFVMLMQRFQRHDRDDIDQPFSSLIKKTRLTRSKRALPGPWGSPALAPASHMSCTTIPLHGKWPPGYYCCGPVLASIWHNMHKTHFPSISTSLNAICLITGFFWSVIQRFPQVCQPFKIIRWSPLSTNSQAAVHFFCN